MKKLLSLLLFTLAVCVSHYVMADEAEVAKDEATDANSTDLPVFSNAMQNSSDNSSDIVSWALSLIGKKYKWGGETPEHGFDCSGFVRFVIGNSINMTLPRTSMAISSVGREVTFNDLLPGDLVFFKNKRGLFAHVGIYLGDKKFIHAPQAGRTIGIDKIEANTFERRFSGARRLIE